MFRTICQSVWLAVFALLLASCGGGGGGAAGYTIGGTVSGLTGTGLVLQNNGADDKTITGDGAFSFTTPVAGGANYNVTIRTQPTSPNQICVASNASGTASANVTNVVITCGAQAYSLTTGVTGLGGISRNPDQSTYPAATQVQLTAVPQPGNKFSSWSGALTGSQNPATVTVNSNISVTANFVSSTSGFLTVAKSGAGTGIVSGGGINCGTICTISAAGGVTLTATPNAGSLFSSWAGCDSVSTNTCTVNVISDRTVTANFGVDFISAPSVSVPSTSANGSYSVTVGATGGIVSSTFWLQEATTPAFINPTQTTVSNVGSYPNTISYGGKAAGTYCYRAAFNVPTWGNTACVTVAAPTIAILRIINNSSYDLIDIQLQGAQQLSYPYVILAGGSYYDFVFSTGGSVSYFLANGFYNSNQTRNEWFTSTGTTNVTIGQTTTLQFNNPSIGQLLTGFAATRNWDGEYWNGLNPYYKRFSFTSSTNGWQLSNSTGSCFGGNTCSYGSAAASGTLQLRSWPLYSSIVTFDFGAGTAAANISYPFGSFMYGNGPSGWSVIQYNMQ